MVVSYNASLSHTHILYSTMYVHEINDKYEVFILWLDVPKK